MIVVSNTSPLTNLAAIEQFDLLRALYGRVHIPDGVWEELNAGGRRWSGAAQVASAEWVEQHGARNTELVAALRRDLGCGEAESIALALELRADLVLLDERDGRHVAQGPGIARDGCGGRSAGCQVPPNHPECGGPAGSAARVGSIPAWRGRLCGRTDPGRRTRAVAP
jgi:uncharacterized protein